MRAKDVSIWLLALLLFALPAAAQVSTSRLEGVVQDESGAVIPGATVSVINNKTQVRSNATTDAAGRFLFVSLRSGEYTLTIEAAGFRTAVRSNLVLNVGDTASEVVKLEIGAVTESVVVEANTVRVQTADAQVGNAVTMRDIDVLPQLGRTPISLAVFQPGAQINPGDTSFTRINGTRQGSSNSTLDGVDVNDSVTARLGLAMTPMNTDSVEEFRIVTTAGKAEYGRSAGGQVAMITRSGTNEWHGGAFDYLRNTVLNANNFFSNQTNTARPKLIQNIFGGSLGGPIFKNRTFIFGNYQGTRVRQEVVRNRTVLTPEAKQGVFRWKQPGTGQIMSFNIAANDPRGKGIDPEMKKIMAMLPDPNNTSIGDILNTAGFRFNAPANSYQDQYTWKADHLVSDDHRAFFRWSWMRTYSIDSTNNQEATFPGQTPGAQGGHRWGWSTGSDWVLTPGMVNELRAGYQSAGVEFMRPARLAGPMIISNSFTDPLATAFPQGRNSPVLMFTDNLTFIRGEHTFKVGGQFRYTKQVGFNNAGMYPNITLGTALNPVPTTIGPTGASVIASADRSRFENLYNDVLGRWTQVTQTYYTDLKEFLPAGTPRIRDYRFREHGYFFQDDWKLRRNLTLNLGLRYEYFGTPREANGYQGTLDRADQMGLSTQFTDLKVVQSKKFFDADKNNFAPRAGFAWDIFGTGKTALRGNWGIYYDRMLGAAASNADTYTPGFSQAVPINAVDRGTDLRISDGVPNTDRPAQVNLTPPLDRGLVLVLFPTDLRSGYVNSWSLSVQQEIFRNTVVEAAYVGNRGNDLFLHRDVNQARVYEDFLGAFKELQAFRKNGTAPSAGNTLVRLFGSAATAVTRIGGTSLDNGLVGTAANLIDRTKSMYSLYAGAGLPATYIRNYPQFNYVIQGSNEGESSYDSFQLSFRRAQGALKFSANYTFSKTLDNSTTEGNNLPPNHLDHFNLSLNRGRADFDRPHAFNSSFSYTLPIGRGRKFGAGLPGWADSLIGGWEVGVLSIWQSGSVFSVSSGRVTGPYWNVNTLANYSGDRNIGEVRRESDGVYWFTPEQMAQFTFPGAGEYGTSGRNTFRGPRFFNVDASLVKSFRIREGHAVRFRAEGYNIFNNANFANPGTNISTPASFGKIGGLVTGPSGSATGIQRAFQMVLRYDF